MISAAVIAKAKPEAIQNYYTIPGHKPCKTDYALFGFFFATNVLIITNILIRVN